MTFTSQPVPGATSWLSKETLLIQPFSGGPQKQPLRFVVANDGVAGERQPAGIAELLSAGLPSHGCESRFGKHLGGHVDIASGQFHELMVDANLILRLRDSCDDSSTNPVTVQHGLPVTPLHFVAGRVNAVSQVADLPD